MQFSGEEHFALAPEELWGRLIDVAFIAGNLPGVASIESVEPKVAVCRVRPGFSFLTGSLKMTVEIIDEQPPRAARMRVHGEGIAASLIVETSMELMPTSGGTNLVWNGEVTQISGLLKTISRGLLEGAAKKVISDGWKNIRDELTPA